MSEVDGSWRERAYASMRRFYLNPDTLPAIKAIGLGVAYAFFSWYMLSYAAKVPTPPKRGANALIEQQKGIQSLVCDSSNQQHFNPEECDLSKELEMELYGR